LTKVLIDADPGTDDALALMMALNSSKLSIQGVTTVGGNATLRDTTRNALRLMEHIDRADVPVSRGSARPLMGRYHYGYYYHGPAGLGVRLATPRTEPHPARAPEFIANLGSKLRGELVIIALGPLTNIARALAIRPRLADWTREIVVMGGAVQLPGNVTPPAEFNVYNDPVAADIVFSSGVPITLVALDVCTQIYVTRDDMPWPSGETRTALLTNRILGNWFKTHPDRDRYHLCDPLALAAAIQPDLLTYRPAKVAVETEDREQLGRTVAQFGDGPIKVAVGVDTERSKAVIRQLLAGSSAT
jgi:inosine-uridine nucleoside N-ribohydrolase